MEQRIFEAAVEGSTISLVNLLQDDPLILDRITVSFYAETPLHIASMLGHSEFVQEILRRKPELAGQLDSRKRSPLHLATAKGHLDIVKKLISVNPEMCFARDHDGKNPIYIAAIKGNVSVLKELAKVRPDAARFLMDRGETILHACVRFDQLETMKVLAEAMSDDEFMNSKDDGGNTILHLAVADKQLEVIKFLMTNNTIDVNAVNESGFTALDILMQNRRDLKDLEIVELLRFRGAISGKDIHISTYKGAHDNNEFNAVHPQGKRTKKVPNEKDDDWSKEMNSALMVVASLIATVTFQAGLNPPGGVWQETTDSGSARTEPGHTAGHSVLAKQDRPIYNFFFIFNTTGFVASLSIILLLVSGLPFFNRRFFTWILMVILWAAITSIAVAYIFSISSLIDNFDALQLYAPSTILCIWVGLMVILLLAHTISLILKTIKYFRKRRGTKGSNSGDEQHSIFLILKTIKYFRKRRGTKGSNSGDEQHYTV